MISIEEIEKLANLARIKVSGEDQASLLNDIGSILSYIDKIKEIKTDNENSINTGSIYNVYRDDESFEGDTKTKDSIMNNVPYKEGDFVAVKKIISQD